MAGLVDMVSSIVSAAADTATAAINTVGARNRQKAAIEHEDKMAELQYQLEMKKAELQSKQNSSSSGSILPIVLIGIAIVAIVYWYKKNN